MVTFERMVTKRDGSKAPFDSTRIRDAITKAILAVECGMSNDLGHRSKVMLRADAKADRFTKEVMSWASASTAPWSSPSSRYRT
jgi:anaerobic ribonucleoside-triphosphate reductase